MSVKRKDIIKKLEQNGFSLLREGRKSTGMKSSKWLKALTGNMMQNRKNYWR